MTLAASLLRLEHQEAIAGDAKQPRSERTPLWVETRDPLRGRNEYLLGRLLRQLSTAHSQDQAELVHGIKMPRKQLPPGQLAAALGRVDNDDLSFQTHPLIAHVAT